MESHLEFEDHFTISKNRYKYYSIEKAEEKFGREISLLPSSLKILLENILRHHCGSARENTVKHMVEWVQNGGSSKKEISYKPSRVLMQDFTGVPAVVDLAAMRDAIVTLNGSAKKINPQIPVDLVIDHSIQVDSYGTKASFDKNVSREFMRNKERYEFLKWGQKSFENFRVVPPGHGICHQVNLEYLASVVHSKKISASSHDYMVYPDTVIGTDSHTTMINGLSVLGWGVGGIEAEAAMLGESVSMLIPEVVGVELKGSLAEGVTATDLVLYIVNMLRKEGVVGKFVEFYGDGVLKLSLPNRATIANMAPEYGATCGFFPTDRETINYLNLTGRKKPSIAVVEKYTKLQNLWHDKNYSNRVFSRRLHLDLAGVKSCIAGPKRPQDKIVLSDSKKCFQSVLDQNKVRVQRTKNTNLLDHGSIVIAAITSCTNTSNPSVMVAAGLLAKKAVALGMKVPSWVKTSLAPGSQLVTEYLESSGLQSHLNKLGFSLVGYGCTTCIGNSGPLKRSISDYIKKNNIKVSAVLSGNRNFEGRIHPLVSYNYLASPPLVVAYALAGTMNIDILKESIGKSESGEEVYLKDIWPSDKEIEDALSKSLSRKVFIEKYKNIFSGTQDWRHIDTIRRYTYNWHDCSTYIKNPPYFDSMSHESGRIDNIKQAKILCVFGDSITTDHISPAGNISSKSPAGKYLKKEGVSIFEFNSYGARRGNHEVMMRGTFANIRIKNEMMMGEEGGFTLYGTHQKVMSIYDAAMKYKKHNVQLVVIAGKEYGSGSSRDWAAKGPKLLGIKAIIAESFERIHRSNLIGMGIIPLTFTNDQNRKSLKITGKESIDIVGFDSFSLGGHISARIDYSGGKVREIRLNPMIYTQSELDYIKNGGVLEYVLRTLL